MLRLRSLIFGAALLLATTASALAHSYPKTMSPAPGSTVGTAPGEVVINFTEALLPRFSSLEVVNSAGARVDRGGAHLAPGDHRRFVVDLPRLPRGTYTVIWRATSVDTHQTHGSYRFTVAH